MLLTDLSVGQTGIIERVLPDFSLYTRLTDIGFSKDAEIKNLMKSPLGDPTAYLIKGTIIALRQEDAKNIYLRGDYLGSY